MYAGGKQQILSVARSFILAFEIGGPLNLDKLSIAGRAKQVHVRVRIGKKRRKRNKSSFQLNSPSEDRIVYRRWLVCWLCSVHCFFIVIYFVLLDKLCLALYFSSLEIKPFRVGSSDRMLRMCQFRRSCSFRIVLVRSIKKNTSLRRQTKLHHVIVPKLLNKCVS